jgi:hypothetical protein
MRELRVVVTFDEGISDAAQGKALLDLEKGLRQSTGLDVRVFKERMGDDSKLRVKMTPAERERV